MGKRQKFAESKFGKFGGAPLAGLFAQIREHELVVPVLGGIFAGGVTTKDRRLHREFFLEGGEGSSVRALTQIVADTVEYKNAG